MNYLVFSNPLTGLPFIMNFKNPAPTVVITRSKSIDNWKNILSRFIRNRYTVEDYVRFIRKIEFYDYNSLSPIILKKIIEKYNIEIGFITTFSDIIKPQLYSLFPKGVYNFHPSILPAHGGADPIYWVLKNKDRFTGTTCHKITDRLDTGEILLQSNYLVGDMNYKKLFARYVQDVSWMYKEILDNFDYIYANRRLAVDAVFDSPLKSNSN
ncbi:MAG: hypothetical protein A2315_17120 [Ignavibacteria bacterium RIFOXYB2_FULL_35_12]|nr:MAG: hypothetical protein A2X60_16105 [Ignavibacteria bacterium GWF2_35_20]OGU85771.1 MAG: hypothetical protein A3K31_00785 [Ignavibacteria bacterium RIFOXYA12_FULL_35_25]OGU93146.1 MAG: hypothetical protein A2347_08085 [Ignavibacteria bacterium RIFOXYB12_FULL_35_14]OGU98302.1 MAG: hypothetical protein A2455_15810 [Ignavibacteria bacterium RIFOXYC2_FULL_35_16]OGV03340.1 MAG: hypothetical protein A2315_17120 [Ignavibacteria bacterium RIFOXYB2_FULL_35_12]OGV31073.1 MAG: hypothetical protein A